MPRVYFGFDAQSVPGEHIFLSYSRGDAERIKGIALELHKKGLPIWYDDGLIPGNIWEDEIMDNVEQSRITLFFLTKELFMRPKCYMREEFQYAVDFEKPALCIWLDELGNMDCSKLSRDMHKWWNKLRYLHSIEVYHLPSDKAKADEIYHGLCRADRRFTQYAPKPESKPTSQPVQQSARSTNPAPRMNLRVGDRIPFGQYPQGANGEIEPLMWRVLALESGRALLITDKLIDCVMYNETEEKVTWETCTHRRWMNNDFIRKAFSSEELAHIATVTIPNLNRGIFGLKKGNPTSDKIFALSIDEAEKYFSNHNDRMSAPTGYAKKQGCWASDNYSLPTGEKTGWWWLRSPGGYGDRAAYVDYGGDIFRYGSYVDGINGCVRPAFWLNL